MFIFAVFWTFTYDVNLNIGMLLTLYKMTHYMKPLWSYFGGDILADNRIKIRRNRFLNLFWLFNVWYIYLELKNYFMDYDEIDILRASQGRDATDVTFGRLYYAFVMLRQTRKTIKQLTC